MDVEILIEEAVNSGITLWTGTDGTLRFRAPAASLTDSFRAMLTEHRSAVVEALSGPHLESSEPAQDADLLCYYQQLANGDQLDVQFINSTHAVLQIEGAFDVRCLQASVTGLLSRHKILGAILDVRDGVARFRCGQDVAVEFIDLCAMQSNADSVIAEVVWRPFRKNADPLFRPFALRLAEHRHVLGFVLHHLIADVVSVNIVCTELLRGYDAYLRGVPPDIPAPSLQYVDFIVGMNSWLRSKALRHRLNYWKKNLDGVMPCKLLTDHTPDPHCASPIELLVFSFGAERTEHVCSLARELNTTHSLILLAAYVQTLTLLTQQPEVAILFMHHGRDDAKTTYMVGSTQNQLVLRIAAVESSFSALVGVCRDVYLSALRYQLPYHYIHTHVPPVSVHKTCFPEFNSRVLATCSRPGQPGPRISTDERAMACARPYALPPRESACDVQHFPGHKLGLGMDESGIRGRLSYLRSEYDESTVKHAVEVFLRCIDAAAAPGGDWHGSVR